jgi:molybdopterin converting factor small subunit
VSASPGTTPEATVTVLVKYLVSFRERAGRAQEEIVLARGSTLRDLAGVLKERHALTLPDPETIAILNGRGWSQLPDEFATEVADGDVVCLFPPIFGG